jgi:hypothetical protein
MKRSDATLEDGGSQPANATRGVAFVKVKTASSPGERLRAQRWIRGAVLFAVRLKSLATYTKPAYAGSNVRVNRTIVRVGGLSCGDCFSAAREFIRRANPE